jgi:hypothetical protein
MGGAVTPPPPVPYAPPPAPTFVQPGPGIAPSPSPFQYQPAPGDITMNSENYWTKTQKFLQELSFEYTYLYGRGSDPNDLGINAAEVTSTFAFPMFGHIETPLLVTPGFEVDWLQGPSGVAELPPQVYDAYLDFAWYPHPYPWMGFELGLRTGIYSDFHVLNSESLRLMGRAAASLSVSPTMDIVLGAAYLDRLDVKLLPVAGVYYRPTPDWDMYLVFPNPKVRNFIAAVGSTKWWWYAAGEYGGGSWTTELTTGENQFDYNDIRVIGGLEWETQTQIHGHLEIGYVFNREIIYRHHPPTNIDPDDTFMLRAGVGF